MLKRKVCEQTNVLLLNNEDDEVELKRRVASICQHFEINYSDLKDHLYIRSGYGSKFLIVTRDRDNKAVTTIDSTRLTEFCRRHSIGLVVIDPLISIHNVPENDNTEIEIVITEIRSIATKTGAAVLIIHHTKKTGGDSEQHAGDTEAGRGASSLIGAARMSFTLARMAKTTAEKFGIDWKIGNRLIRMDEGKSNFTLRSAEADWYEMQSVRLPNGDYVGVPVPFDMANIAKKKAKEKEDAKSQEQAVKITEIAATVAGGMTENEQPQPEVISAYMAKTGKKETAAKSAVSMLPVGRENASSAMSKGNFTKVWRERIGSETRPYYRIHKFVDD